MVTEANAKRMAQAALSHWGGGDAVLASIRENVVFDTELSDGARVALRLHRPGYRSRAGIEAELAWCAALAQSGFPAPMPVACVNGRRTARVADRTVSCVAWLEGAPMGAPDLADMPEIGALIARLHSAPQPHPFEATPWDSAALLGPTPIWGRFWENPCFSAPDRALIEAARAAAVARLQDTPFAMGAIHGDLLHENILRTRDGLALIDFDDCGRGYLLYDLATALIQSFEATDFDARCAALVEGYQSVRPLADADALPLFIMLRAFASAGWIISRAAVDDPRRALYAERARIAATRVMGGQI